MPPSRAGEKLEAGISKPLIASSKPTPEVTMMHHATKRGFKDCPAFLNSTGRLGPKRGRKCYITPAFSGVPNKGGQNQNSKPPLGVTMMPLGAPSISKYGSLVRPDAQIVRKGSRADLQAVHQHKRWSSSSRDPLLQ